MKIKNLVSVLLLVLTPYIFCVSVFGSDDTPVKVIRQIDQTAKIQVCNVQRDGTLWGKEIKETGDNYVIHFDVNNNVFHQISYNQKTRICDMLGFVIIPDYFLSQEGT